MLNGILEECITSIFRVENQPSKKPAAADGQNKPSAGIPVIQG
jgi:hypothetical protein